MDKSWEQIIKEAVGSLIAQGPLAIVLVGIIAAIGWVIVKKLAPWVKTKVEDAMALAKAGQEERAKVLEEKEALVESHERIERGHEDALEKLGAVVTEQTIAVKDLTRATGRLVDRVGAWDEKMAALHEVMEANRK